ncbi:hypothetical protein [Atlantibacter hermannii]|uniref:hypothetical protein n=1 Tax=Atlantibacter hermannii TaxID=565 RepID=UPI00289B137A|nr:hypothetical protein [Atlantibacter hermannii]
MHIPAFPLSSRPRTEIKFRMPTVADAMRYSDSDPAFEEATSTEYLNAMQVGTVHDSALWTAQDRRTALWWIYINSRIETVSTFTYECQFCGATHFYDFDMRDLSETTSMLTEEPYRRVMVPVQGKETIWTLKPLDGRGITMLERLRFTLPEKESPNYNAAKTEMRIAELALHTALDDDPEDFEQAANRRFDIIKTMATDTEFTPLVANIQLMQRELKHGLEVSISDGQVLLLLPPHACDGQTGEGKATRLLIPFRPGSFIPGFKHEWLVNSY